ncbi:MAG: hypothetical protein ACM65L_22435 [Microcoleus sp.]
MPNTDAPYVDAMGLRVAELTAVRWCDIRQLAFVRSNGLLEFILF